MNLPLKSARLAAWATACLTGLVAPDDVAEHAAAPGQVHRVTGLPDPNDAAGAVSLPLAVAELRRLGARRAWLAWPVSGDPAGLPGPAEVNRLALEAGQAVVVDLEEDGSGRPAVVLVPSRLGSSGVVWTALDAERTGTATSLADAERTLRSTMREATEVLDALDVARTDPTDADLVELVRNRDPGIELPRGFSPRAHALLDTSQRLSGLVSIAGRNEGGAVSRGEGDRRRAVLRDLDRAVRHAFVASVNALAEDGVRAR